MNRYIIFLLSAIILILTVKCANKVSPSGGPKDITPPVLIAADPPNYSVNFSEDRIVLMFNEFINLKDPAKQIFISPPFKIKPEFIVRGKSLLIELKEPLIESMTYTIYFGSAITDIAEGNARAGFEYVFSTGSVVDSLSISGTVLNAFSLKPEPDVLAMVYTDNNDTLPLDLLPLNVPPLNLIRTASDGSFRINNLKNNKYKLIALKDLNNDYFYDQPDEWIGFTDSLVIPEYIPYSEEEDSLESDTISVSLAASEKARNHIVYIFDEADTTQRLLSRSITESKRLQYAFRQPITNFSLQPLNFTDSINWKLPEFNKTRDTLGVWLRVVWGDTLKIRLVADSGLTDTSNFIIRNEPLFSPAKKKKQKDESLTIRSNSISGTFDLNKEFNLTFSAPVEKYNLDGITLSTKEDTIAPVITMKDSIGRIAKVDEKWKEGTSYRLIIPDSAFIDIFGKTNDSTLISFKTRQLSDYGILIMNYHLPGEGEQYIVELLSENENIAKTNILSVSGVVNYSFLYPGKYRIKVIYDRNRNDRWDPGNYSKQLLPEQVSYYPLEFNIRANWELQEEWVIP